MCGDKSYTAEYEDKAFTAGAKWADEHPNWQPVEYALPKRVRRIEPIINVIMTNGVTVGPGTYNDITGQWNWQATGIIATNITHWMPMPAPPAPLDAVL